MAMAGFTPGEAESLRRAMSRKRSREAMDAHWREFRDGARARGVAEETTRTVFEKVIGFSEFGFPKSHAAAFAILAYQSAWLRLHHPAEFLCALLNAQPMGFYPPATLLRDGERRGVTVLPPDVDRARPTARSSRARCGSASATCRASAGGRADRRGGARPRGRSATPATWSRRAPAGRDQLAQLVRAGALRSVLARPRRLLWEIRLHRAPERGRSWRWRWTARRRRRCRESGLGADGGRPRDDGPHHRAAPDGAASAVAAGRDPHAARPASPTRHGSTSPSPASWSPASGPATAKGIVFLLLEDEHGMVNVIVPPEVYERDRIAVRAEPLLVVRGRLERREGTINVLAESVGPLTRPGRAEIGPSAAEPPDVGELRAAAPHPNSFGRGR